MTNACNGAGMVKRQMTKNELTAQGSAKKSILMPLNQLLGKFLTSIQIKKILSCWAFIPGQNQEYRLLNSDDHE